MPNFYRMTERNPCPACGGTHFFRSVPFFEEAVGATFEVTCPETNKTVQVNDPPSEPKQDMTTDVLCGVCKKYNLVIRSQSNPRGSNVVQYLECPNESCGHTMTRQIDIVTGNVVRST